MYNKFEPGEIHVIAEDKILGQNGVDLKLHLFRYLQGDWGYDLVDEEKTLMDDAVDEKNWGVTLDLLQNVNLQYKQAIA